MDIKELAGYAYFISIGLLAIFLYWYIWFVHSDKKRSQDYEKFGRLALDDELSDEVIDENKSKKIITSDENKKGNA